MKQMMHIVSFISSRSTKVCVDPRFLAQAGGSQSAHDNQGRKAKSAGAMLRRYGEQALREVPYHVMCCVVCYPSPTRCQCSPLACCATSSTPL